MSGSEKLVDRLAVLLAVAAAVVGVAAHAPVIGGAVFWSALIGGWLIKRYVRDRAR